jgi:hypothetical protein
MAASGSPFDPHPQDKSQKAEGIGKDRKRDRHEPPWKRENQSGAVEPLGSHTIRPRGQG